MGVSQRTVTGGELIDGVTILNGTVDVNGTANAIILDADGDTHISAPTDDQIDIALGGADDFKITQNNFEALTGSYFSGQGSNIMTCIPMAAEATQSGAGQITTTEYLTKLTTTGANALVLSDGSAVGQLKKILMVVDAGDGTLTPTNLSGGTTITFADAGDYAILAWDGNNWVAIELGNSVDGISAPVLA